MPMGPPSQYLTLRYFTPVLRSHWPRFWHTATHSLKGLGFDTFQTNLLVIPSQVLSMITLLVFTQFAGVTKRLAFNGIIGQVWALPFLIALHTINTSTTNKWIVFAIVTLLLGYPSNHSVQVGWASRNANTVRTRTVSTAMYNMCCQAGSIVYSNIYRAGRFSFRSYEERSWQKPDDAPRYLRGNKELIGIAAGNIGLYLIVNFYYDWVNSRRDKIWNSWSPEEKENYLKTTKDEGSNRLDFRFARWFIKFKYHAD